MIFCCYKNISILKAYEKLQNEKSDLYNMVPHICNYFEKKRQIKVLKINQMY